MENNNEKDFQIFSLIKENNELKIENDKLKNKIDKLTYNYEKLDLDYDKIINIFNKEKLLINN